MGKSTVTIDDHEIAAVSRALSNPARIKILRLLAAQTECRGYRGLLRDCHSPNRPSPSTCGCSRRPASSHQAPVGTAMTYCLRREPLEDLLGLLEEIVTTLPQCDVT
jgi:hypothetical protein